MDKLKPHFWLYETYPDANLICDTCAHFGKPNERSINGKCGRSGWICGDYKPAEEYQITMEAMK